MFALDKFNAFINISDLTGPWNHPQLRLSLDILHFKVEFIIYGVTGRSNHAVIVTDGP